MQVSDDDIKWLLKLLEDEGLVELEVSGPGWRVKVSRAAAQPAGAPTAAAPAPAPAKAADELSAPDIVPILAPMAGTFYRAPAPNAAPYVEEGQEIERGDVVGLIEAMKVFNEIESPVSGTIVKILVENEQQVQADERLMLVRVRSVEGA